MLHAWKPSPAQASWRPFHPWSLAEAPGPHPGKVLLTVHLGQVLSEPGSFLHTEPPNPQALGATPHVMTTPTLSSIWQGCASC